MAESQLSRTKSPDFPVGQQQALPRRHDPPFTYWNSLGRAVTVLEHLPLAALSVLAPQGGHPSASPWMALAAAPGQEEQTLLLTELRGTDQGQQKGLGGVRGRPS